QEIAGLASPLHSPSVVDGDEALPPPERARTTELPRLVPVSRGPGDTHSRGPRATGGSLTMNVRVRPASLQDGVAVLELLEEVGYYPEPIAFAKTYRKTLCDPHFLVRVAEAEGKIVGMASL